MVKIIAAISIAAIATSALATACFDDNYLQALDAQQVPGALLYVWSPRMVLSAQHAATAQRQAQQHGLRFVPLHDAGVPQEEVLAARQRLHNLGPQSAHALVDSQPLCAAILLERDALRHFPTAFVVQASGVHRYPIIGAMPETAWAMSISQRLSAANPQANPSAKTLAVGRSARSEAQR
jgi:hypothetical protein